jgi:hypothetical protein
MARLSLLPGPDSATANRLAVYYSLLSHPGPRATACRVYQVSERKVIDQCLRTLARHRHIVEKEDPVGSGSSSTRDVQRKMARYIDTAEERLLLQRNPSDGVSQ